VCFRGIEGVESGGRGSPGLEEERGLEGRGASDEVDEGSFALSRAEVSRESVFGAMEIVASQKN